MLKTVVERELLTMPVRLPHDYNHPPKQPSGLDGQTKLLVLTAVLLVLLLATYR